MELLTNDELAALVETDPGSTQVSLFIPTHRFGDGIEVDRLQWKNLVSGVEAVLGQDLRAGEVEALIAPAHRLQDDDMAWRYMSDGLAMFLRSDWHRTFRLAADLPVLATVGDRLVMGPMLGQLPGDDEFLVLALSQRDIRLLECTRANVEEIELTGVPTRLQDVVESQEPRSDTMARPAAGASRGGPAVFFGHGAGDQHFKKEEVARFLREVSNGLRGVLTARTTPMVLVGLEQLVATYREVNSYGHLLEEAVDHNADQLSAEELHAMAWQVMEERLGEEQAQVIDRFHQQHGTGRVSSDVQTVSEAAAQGRVETLFVNANPWCWERITTDSTPIVQLGTDERYAVCEAVDAAAVATLTNGGQVHGTDQPVVPDSEVAAIFRY